MMARRGGLPSVLYREVAYPCHSDVRSNTGMREMNMNMNMAHAVK